MENIVSYINTDTESIECLHCESQVDPSWIDADGLCVFCQEVK